jgi:hypothetical protein
VPFGSAHFAFGGRITKPLGLEVQAEDRPRVAAGDEELVVIRLGEDHVRGGPVAARM